MLHTVCVIMQEKLAGIIHCLIYRMILSITSIVTYGTIEILSSFKIIVDAGRFLDSNLFCDLVLLNY